MNAKTFLPALGLSLFTAFVQSQFCSVVGKNEHTTVVSDSLQKQMEEAKRELQGSPPEDQVQSTLPTSGQTITGRQKREVVRDSSKISDIDPTNSPKKLPARKSDGTPTVALALGGGGARGAAHIGVLRVLEQEGIHIDSIVGNSMGSIVGGMYCAGLSLNVITENLAKLHKAYMPGGVVNKIVSLPLVSMLRPFQGPHYAGLWSGKKLTDYLEKVLPEPNMEVSQTKIPFSSVATNLLDGKAYRITDGRLSTAIKASAAISPIIQPVALDDKLFIDGGIRANLPASAARDTGAGIVIAVLVDEPLQEMPPKRFTKIKNIASRMSDVVLAVADERQLQFADVVINPDVSNIAVFANSQEDIEKAVHAGELAARKAMPQLARMMQLHSVSVPTAPAASATN